MAVRTRMSPGVEWKEIDKSGYSPTMAGCSVYLKGFSSKGEAYKPMMITTRSAFEQIYGAPDNEAERYFYAGACEVLNQGGRLFCARLPYDNEAFEKMVGVKYVVEFAKDNIANNKNISVYNNYLTAVDPEIKDAAIITGGKTPMLYDLSAVDEFRTDEAKVPANTFLIVDTTCATYKRVVEDWRKGQKREVIGIIPVVTTAANALYVQNYIDLSNTLSDVNKFESLGTSSFLALKATDEEGNIISVDGVEMTNISGLISSDLVRYIACDSYFHDFSTVDVNVLTVDNNLSVAQYLSTELCAKTGYNWSLGNMFVEYADAVNALPYVAQNFNSQESKFSISSVSSNNASKSWSISSNVAKINEDIRNFLTSNGANGREFRDQTSAYNYKLSVEDHFNFSTSNVSVITSIKYSIDPKSTFGSSLSIDGYLKTISELSTTGNSFNIQTSADNYILSVANNFNISANQFSTVKTGSIYEIQLNSNANLDIGNVLKTQFSQSGNSFTSLADASQYALSVGQYFKNSGQLSVTEFSAYAVDAVDPTGFTIAESYLSTVVQPANMFLTQSDAQAYIASVSSYFNLSAINALSVVKNSGNQLPSLYYSIISTAMTTLTLDENGLKQNEELLSANGYDISTDLLPLLGWHGLNMDDTVPNTIALEAAGYFPTIQPSPDDNGGLDPEHLKDIGVVVYKAYLDPSEGNKVNVEPVEAYAGSLYKDDKDPNTGVTKFIDTIINSQSQYINFFSNCFSNKLGKDFYKNDCDIILAPPQAGATLGLYSPMTKKDISISKSILDGMNKCFEKVADINERDIDIVPDAGLANIASYIKAIFGEKGPYDLAITDDLGNSLLGMWTCKKATDAWVKIWKTVLFKHDTFCKNTRKDCMFVADGLRPLVLAGQKKIVRDTKPSNSIDKDILPYIPAICGINTSYGAGYADWFEQADDYTGDFFWCPPSIKATGCYVNTDLNFDYWLAPAGLTRGIIAATDVAFSPNDKQAGAFYEKNWNYAINYPSDGIILEGQKTFQTKPTALDRVNVRRMMLRLERQVYKVLRYFVYENNTAYTRQRIIDAIEPILKACWQSGNGGLARYKIVCDESINTPNVIDNNELKIAIGVVPNKSAEYLMVDWIIGSSGATWEELF